MEFREKPMQNLIRIKEKEICKKFGFIGQEELLAVAQAISRCIL